jgi:hypothetical protein
VRRRVAAVADWLIAIGAVGLFVSLFLTWSHQFTPQLLALPGSRVGLRGVPADPTAWQVYAAADVVLALLAVALGLAALVGARWFRLVMVPFVGLAVAFVVHAISSPPTNGVRVVNPGVIVPAYLPVSATAGVGETVALAALGVALVGIVASVLAE